MVLAIVAIIGVPIVITLVFIFAKIRRGIGINEYLGLGKPSWKTLLKWSAVLLVFATFTELLSFYIKETVVEDFSIKMYTTVNFAPLLWFAVIICAPISEEVFFRGFLLKGIASSKIGSIGAIIVTALVWSVLHTQYDIYYITVTFLGGLLLGQARLKSNSIYIPIVMHIIWNLIATIEIIIYLKVV